MTATWFMDPRAAAAEPFRRVRVGARRHPMAVGLLVPIGAAIVVVAYHHAAELTGPPDQLQFVLFWAGFFTGMLPLVAVACASKIDDTVRTCALAGIGVFGMLPKLLTLPTGPLGTDEFAHMRQVLEAFLNGDVGHVTYLLPISRAFPGMHQAISAVARLTGLPLWSAGLLIIVLAHVLSVLAVYRLLRALGATSPGSAVGAVVYTLNPSWAFFDTAVSYESLALPLLLWCLAGTVAASRSSVRVSMRHLAIAVLSAAALPVIHHLTTIMLCLILVLLIGASLVRKARRRRALRTTQPRDGTAVVQPPQEFLWPLLLVGACLLASILYWWSDKYDWLVSYLSPALTQGWAQLTQLVGLSAQTPTQPSGGRAVFGGAQNPLFEVVSALLFPPVVLVLFLVSGCILWRHRRVLGSAPWGFVVLAAMYFPSLPMVLTKGGGEGAHRSWAISFIGIAVVCGLAWSFASRDGATTRSHLVLGPFARYLRRVDRPAFRIGTAIVVFAVLACGGIASGENVSSRFPGSANVGDDSRSVTREGAAVATWLASHAPVDTPVLADRYVSMQVGSWGRMAALKPSEPFALWNIYMNAGPISREVLQQVLSAQVRYFVVDSRMATTRPRMGYWFTKDEPGVGGTTLFPQVAIDRFNCLPWLHAAFAAGPLTVYEVDPAVLHRTMAGSCDRQDSQ